MIDSPGHIWHTHTPTDLNLCDLHMTLKITLKELIYYQIMWSVLCQLQTTKQLMMIEKIT